MSAQTTIAKLREELEQVQTTAQIACQRFDEIKAERDSLAAFKQECFKDQERRLDKLRQKCVRERIHQIAVEETHRGIRLFPTRYRLVLGSFFSGVDLRVADLPDKRRYVLRRALGPIYRLSLETWT